MAKKKTSNLSNLFNTGPKKLLVFLIAFVVIGGGVMAYSSFAAAGCNNCTDNIRRIKNAVKNNIGGANFQDIWACSGHTNDAKNDTYSEHGWGNAIDYTEGEKEVLKYLVRHGKNLKVANILWQNRRWSSGDSDNPDKFYDLPVDKDIGHEDHLHVSALPTHIGKGKPPKC